MGLPSCLHREGRPDAASSRRTAAGMPRPYGLIHPHQRVRNAGRSGSRLNTVSHARNGTETKRPELVGGGS
jgi:hypothetical protein